ncbi:hypothetical protein ACIBCN_02150 [Nocardia sp. NPDC051052]|uniref:hypothetical protein n=1 Tax=Nocardia sp. NPDC051052 TaxID=3364322 RepID=UPI0037A61831
MSSRKKYPAELRERAVRMYAEIREQHESEWAAMRAVTLTGRRLDRDVAGLEIMLAVSRQNLTLPSP